MNRKKIILTYIFIVIIVILMIYLLIKRSNYLINNDNKIKNEFDNTTETTQKQENRVIYKEGFYYEELNEKIKNKITGISYPSTFDEGYYNISYYELVYVKVKYYDFDLKEHTNGEIIINKLLADELLKIMYELYENKYPFASINLVEEYNGIDELSMKANNTSAFNYRVNEDSDKLSWHAFGTAIDINPLYNPYVMGNVIYPSNAYSYIDRTKNFVGKIDKNDLCYKVFTKYGWSWGGDFYYPDYQHFYKVVYDENLRNKRG